MRHLSFGSRIAVLCAGVLVGSLLQDPAAALNIEAATEASVHSLLVEAGKAHARHDIASEERLLRTAVSLEGPLEELAEAERLLARLAWRFHRRYLEARSWLKRAKSRQVDLAETLLEQSLLSFHLRDFDESRALATKALEYAETLATRRRCQVAFAMAAVEEATIERLQGKRGTPEPVRVAFEMLGTADRSEPGDPRVARTLLAAALLLNEGPTALSAWRSYFHVSPNSPAPNLVRKAGENLELILADWQAPGLTGNQRVVLTRALAHSRFFTEAALVALDPLASDADRLLAMPQIREIVGYARFCRRINAITREFYRKTALGREERETFLRQLADAAQSLWPHLVPPKGQPPVASESSLEDRLGSELERRFGTYFSVGETAGYYDLHMGHSVLDESHVADHYGNRAELRFISLDTMVSNGFQSWAWRRGQHGGWNKKGTIYQVRPAYVGAPLRAWRQVAEDKDRKEFMSEMARESVADEERARMDSTAYLPGLRMRLLHQGRENLLKRLEGRGLAGDSLRMAFLKAHGRAVVESSIFAHEGRHAIEKTLWQSYFADDATREFGAKLSEVVFAPEPRLAIGAIFSDTIGSKTPHGQANLRIMKGLVAWMKANAQQIQGLDSARPLLPQFDRLTDDQIRAAFRSLDSLAN